MVKLATVNYRHQNSSGPMENLKAYGELIDKAAEAGVHMICLPEGVTMVGTGKTYLEVAETVPGPTTRYLGELARINRMYIVAGIYEKEGKTTYNTAVLIGKKGELMGRYRKVSLPREEIEGGLTPGDKFPVFDTDFGRVGILICWDIQFPEGARRLAANGAEIILLPIWGGIEPLYPARAIENQIILVTSSFDSTTGIWNRRGEEAARADQEGTLAIAEFDLSEEIYWEWLGNLRARIARESPIVKEVTNH
jgi:predicted amidohydrolase